MTKFKITKEIFDYISEHSANFSEVTPSPTLGEEWIVKDIKTYPNVNNGNSVVEAEREDGCYIRLPENIVKIYTIDKEQTGKFGLQEEPVSENLEEFALQYAGHHAPYDSCWQEVEDAVKADAQWNKDKLDKVIKLADAMYYAAFNMTTDASGLRKAMKDYHNYIIHMNRED